MPEGRGSFGEQTQEEAEADAPEGGGGALTGDGGSGGQRGILCHGCLGETEPEGGGGQARGGRTYLLESWSFWSCWE